MTAKTVPQVKAMHASGQNIFRRQSVDALLARIEELESEERWANYYQRDAEALRARIAELEANIVEADAQWNTDKKPRPVNEAEIALVRCMSMGAEAMSEVERLKAEVMRLQLEWALDKTDPQAAALIESLNQQIEKLQRENSDLREELEAETAEIDRLCSLLGEADAKLTDPPKGGDA